MKEETPALFPGEGVQGSKRHGEIKVKPFGAFEMAMKGRGDASRGRCEERGRKVDGATRQQRGNERKNRERDEKGNKAIKGRRCLAGPSPPPVPTETDEHTCWPRRESPFRLHQQHPLLFVPPQGRDQGPAQLQRHLVLVGFCMACIWLSVTPLPHVLLQASPGASISIGNFPAIPGKIPHPK